MIEVKVRAIAIKNNSIFLVRHHKGDHLALPGGKVESGELLKVALTRELKEELDIDASIGKLLFIHELIIKDRHMVEFFFYLNNSDSLDSLNNNNASHKHELHEFGFFKIEEIDNLKPEFLKTEFLNIQNVNPNDLETKLFSYLS